MTITAPTSIKTDPIKFTSPERQRLAAASAELNRLDNLLAEVVKIKSVIDSAEDDFASGKISIREAVGLLFASSDSSARARLEGQLRRPVKSAIRATVATVADLIDKSRQHHVAELASKAAGLEKSERATLTELGMEQDDFNPSDLLLGIREQHSRAKADASHPPTRDMLTKLLASL